MIFWFLESLKAETWEACNYLRKIGDIRCVSLTEKSRSKWRKLQPTVTGKSRCWENSYLHVCNCCKVDFYVDYKLQSNRVHIYLEDVETFRDKARMEMFLLEIDELQHPTNAQLFAKQFKNLYILSFQILVKWKY